jgi:hypothetical protein
VQWQGGEELQLWGEEIMQGLWGHLQTEVLQVRWQWQVLINYHLKNCVFFSNKYIFEEITKFSKNDTRKKRSTFKHTRFIDDF